MTKTLPTFRAEIFMAGNIDVARQWLRHRCYHAGLCVTVTSADFIYTGGEESGFVVGLVNYPRFPSAPQQIRDRAVEIAEGLVVHLCQRTALVVDTHETTWITIDPPGAST